MARPSFSQVGACCEGGVHGEWEGIGALRQGVRLSLDAGGGASNRSLVDILTEVSSVLCIRGRSSVTLTLVENRKLS